MSHIIVSETWDTSHVTNKLISDFRMSSRHTGTLKTAVPKIFHQTKALSIPNFELDYQPQASKVLLSIEDLNDIHSASSIAATLSQSITLSHLRTFIHDFTFAIISVSTDMSWTDEFPHCADQYVRQTPDLILSSPDVKLVLEFATTQNNLNQALLHQFEVKKFKYAKAMQNRLTLIDPTTRYSTYYGLSPIITSGVAICMDSSFDPSPRLVNELCARFRLATAIVAEAMSKGVKLEETEIGQIRSDILSQIANIKPKLYQSDTTHKAGFTMERIITDDVSELSAINTTKLYYKDSLKKAFDVIDDKDLTPPVDVILKKHKDQISGTRMDPKSILNLPGIIPTYHEGWSLEISDLDGPYSSFSNKILSAIDKPTWSCEISTEEHIRIAMLEHDDPELIEMEKKRRQYKRVSCVLDTEEKIEFAKLGVEAKSMLKNVEVKLYRESKKESFALDVDVSDIDDYLQQPLEINNIDVPSESMMCLHLLSLANKLAGDVNNVNFSVVESLMKTNLFRWCHFISSIGVELCLSLKQNVHKGEWVVKKMKYHNCYIVIKPTNSNSHIFYYLILDKTCSEIFPSGISKHLQKHSHYITTEWCSYTIAKLVNLIKADSFLIANYSQWCRFYGVLPEEGFKNDRVNKMMRLSLLIHLEDKPRTEELCTLFRYISMEKFSTVTKDCSKMLDKFPTVLRSRLQVWVTHKLIYAMCSGPYINAKPKKSESGILKPSSKWLNLINPYTGELLENPQQLIELFYIGYATNKDAKTWENTEFDLVKKIIKYEQELELARSDKCGLVEPESFDDIKFHEWSRKANCAAADYLKQFLHAKYGNHFESKITQTIIHRLGRLTWEEVATLKASSTFNPNEPRVQEMDGKFLTRRIKVVIALLRHWGELSDTPALSLNSILEWVDSDGGLRVDIFRKNQHGGLREIYVLDIHSRVLQLCIEEISRAICQELPIEMMMHPENKINKPQEHMFQSALRKEKFKYNISSSNDAKVWNQGHHVAKFAQFLCRFLPKDFHGLIINGLQQWLNKRISLPDGVINFLTKQPWVSVFDPVHSDICKAFRGEINVPWLKPGAQFITVESGMMQGILHYTSSLYHAAILMLRDKLWRQVRDELSITCVSMDLVSSDDSSRMTDVFSNDLSSYKGAIIWAKADHCSIKWFSNLFGIFLSPKSTLACNGIMEFNSEFFFRASLCRPTLKWSLAALGIVEVESLYERQEILYNQLTELLEGGAGFIQTHLTQISQGILFYKMLGSGVNPIFGEYAQQLVITPDPSLGFFLIDPHLISGLPGLKYSHWCVVTKNHRVNKIMKLLLLQGEMTTTTVGTITRGTQVRFGNREKTKRIILECEKELPNWRTTIEDNPEVLYKVARDMQSSLLKMLVKLTSPSVITSLSKGNGVSRLIASSVYLINRMATTIGSNWTSALSEIDGSVTRKTSLWKLIISDVGLTDFLTDQELKLFFPYAPQYESLSQLNKDLSSYKLSKFGSKKKLRTHVLVFTEELRMPFSFEEIIRWKWFGEILPASTTMLKDIWTSYTTLFPWIRDTAHETLNNPECHLESHIQLRNFIARQTSKSRVVHLTGSQIRDSASKDLIRTAIERNQLIGYTLIGPEEAVTEHHFLVSLQSQIASLISFPLRKEVKVAKIVEVLANSPTIWNGEPVRPSYRRLRLSLIQQFVKLSKSPRARPLINNQFRNLLRLSKMGVYGGFTKRQVSYEKGASWTGPGEWRGLIGSASVILTLMDQTLLSVRTNKIDELRENEALLSNLLREFGISNYKTSFPSQLFFDLNHIRLDPNGAPVYEDQELFLDHVIEMPTMKLILNNDILRLIHIGTTSSPEHTIVSYSAKSWDYNFSKAIVTKPSYLESWLNNSSLAPNYAHRMLSIIAFENKILQDIDQEQWIKFVKISLLSSLVKAGWFFKQISDLDILPFIQETSDDLASFMHEEDFFELQLDFELMKEVDHHSHILGDEVIASEYDIHDIFLGELPIDETKVMEGDIRRTHRYWSNYCSNLSNLISKQDKRILEDGYYNSNTKSLADILTYYCGLEFKEKKLSMQLPSVSEIDPDDEL